MCVCVLMCACAFVCLCECTEYAYERILCVCWAMSWLQCGHTNVSFRLFYLLLLNVTVNVCESQRMDAADITFNFLNPREDEGKERSRSATL